MKTRRQLLIIIRRVHQPGSGQLAVVVEALERAAIRLRSSQRGQQRHYAECERRKDNHKFSEGESSPGIFL
jgi:hypothetical protein